MRNEKFCPQILLTANQPSKFSMANKDGIPSEISQFEAMIAP